MFEMVIYVLYFSLSRSNRRLQEFQSTCRQGMIRTVASTDAAITNMHFLFITTFIGDSEVEIICILWLNVGRRKPEALKPSFIFNLFTAFKCSKFLFSKLKCSYFIKNPSKVIRFFSKISNYVIIFLYL